MKHSKPYCLEVCERAIRMVFEHQAEYASQWAVIGSNVLNKSSEFACDVDGLTCLG